jgi:tRNA threonylcarbamoyl adenosine modification protein YjeE
MHDISISLQDLKDTAHLAELLSAHLKKADTLLLKGDLGSGKTTFAQFLIRALIPTVSNVQSPTFNIVNSYEDKKHTVSHLDLYRLKHQDELLEIGLEEFLYNGITIIEWPELAENIIHKNKITISFNNHFDSDARSLVLSISGRFIYEESGLLQHIEREFNAKNRSKK